MYNANMETIISNFLKYSFKDINFNYNELTEKEKRIFRNKETFEKILKEFKLKT